MAGILGKENEVPKKDHQKIEGNEVKYCQFVMRNFAALLRLEIKILAQ